MSTNDRQSKSAVDTLLNNPKAFDFLQALRILEQIADSDDALRFVVDSKLDFSSAAISKISVHSSKNGKKNYTVRISGIGLMGAYGSLPNHYSELILQRIHHKDNNIADFFNLFNHRIIALYYQSCKKYRLNFNMASYKNALRGMLGIKNPSLENRLTVPDDTLLYYSGLFLMPRSAIGLQQILNGYFGVKIAITQFMGKLLLLKDTEKSCLGSLDASTDHYNILGKNAVIGNRFFDIQNKFRIKIGPLSYRSFQEFLPNTSALNAMIELTRFYVGINIDFDMTLIINREEVPPCQLQYKNSYRLGWTSRLGMKTQAGAVYHIALNPKSNWYKH